MSNQSKTKKLTSDQFSMRVWCAYCNEHIQPQLNDNQKKRLRRMLATECKRAWRELAEAFRPLPLPFGPQTWQEGLEKILRAILDSAVPSIMSLSWYDNAQKKVKSA
jgi:hypothetical protein